MADLPYFLHRTYVRLLYVLQGKKGSDPQRFNIEVEVGESTGKVFKFKAKSKEEGERWVEALEEWREYALVTMPY